MFNMSFEERIRNYDAHSEYHYYVYKDFKGIHKVDVIYFKEFSDLKDNYFKKKIYYDTYAEARIVADRLNKIKLIEDKKKNLENDFSNV